MVCKSLFLRGFLWESLHHPFRGEVSISSRCAAPLWTCHGSRRRVMRPLQMKKLLEWRPE